MAALALVLVLVLANFWPSSKADLQLPETVDFNYHIRPILSQNCYVCHGPDESSREAGLRLDNREAAVALLESGSRAILPGKPRRSALIERIKSSDPNLQMPPPAAKKTLSEREIALLERWIRQGATWKEHWAFLPPSPPKLPPTLATARTSATIDHFVEQALVDRGLEAVGSAKPNTLIRRVAYLLTGLPPTKSELDSLGTDFSIEKVADHYLASPHFGERWARHWMDLVRYGESMGHEGDYNISNAYEYRDYLIRAFNQDVPYDLFVKEHLAGDLLENPRYNPAHGFNESVMGTAYFFLGEGKHSPVDTRVEESEKIDNMIDVTSKTFMSLTVACAKCHDHKFDPIPTTDYYSMYGMIESSRLGPIPARRTLEQEQLFAELKDLKQAIREKLQAQLAQHLELPKPQLIRQQAQFISEKVADSTDYKILADFRDGSWEGWYTNGWAFGEGPLRAEPMLDVKTGQIRGLERAKVSSRFYAPGIQGILRSPNFTIEHDYIAVKAAGNIGSIRVIIDNFQVIQNPLWGRLEAVVKNSDWDTYVLDVHLLKGHKAYLQFMPGHYGAAREHIYRIQPEDYIEVEYAFAYNGDLPKMPVPKAKDPSIASITQIDQEHPELAPLLERYQEIAPRLYDSTHVIGMNDGAAIFSPVFIRGSLNNLSEEKVPRRFLKILEKQAGPFPQQGSGRLAFAEAISSPNNPLTARIIANRIWHHIFGRGIVETVDNFGLQGKLPSHPELLDFLALEMIEQDWSMKSLIKSILLTQTFQRSTQLLEANQSIDPNAIYLHHFPIRRLEGEAIRDGILAVSGELDRSMYGPSVPVHLTEYMTGRGRPQESGPLDGAGRRSIYTAVRRNFISPMLLAFDMPIPFSTFGRRNTTNVPAQSLTLMNDAFVKDQARKWAKNICAEAKSTEERIEAIYWKAFARAPREEEMQQAKAFLQQQAAAYSCTLYEMQEEVDLWAAYCHAIFNLKEFIHLL